MLSKMNSKAARILGVSAIAGMSFAAPALAQSASGGLADGDVVQPENTSKYVPGVWTDPDGCEHWVMDDGIEGFMTPNVTPDGRPVCQRGATCLVAGSDQLFSVGSANISTEARETLTEFFEGQPSVGYVVEGHTDSDGSDAFNLDLSKRRAEAVATIARGAGAKNIEIRAYGERDPIASNGSSAGKAKNRRVEIQCIKSSSGGKLAGGLS